MTTLHFRLDTRVPAPRVYAYLKDFRHATEWDAGTERCDLISGDGELGSRYHNVSRFMGRAVDIIYTLTVDQPGRLVFVGETPTVTSRDDILIEPRADGTTVDYTATFTYKGLWRFVSPLFAPALKRLERDTRLTMQAALDRHR